MAYSPADALRSGNKFARLGNALKLDARRMWLPAFLVSVLCFAQDYVITNVLGIPRTFARFAVWNALYTFGWVWITKKRCKSFLEASYVFVANSAMYLLVHAMKAFFAHYTRLWLFIPIVVMVMTAIEYLHFQWYTVPRNLQLRAEAKKKGIPYDEKNEEKYVVRRISSTKDHLYGLFIILVFVSGSYLLDISVDGFAGWQLFLVAIPNGIMGDILFGVPHNLGHRVPWLWQKHKIHHEYRGNEMTLFANNYLEYLDGILSAQPVLFVLFQDYFLGLSAWHLIDGTIVALFSHHKYPGHYIGSYWAYEIDILLDVLIDHKIAMFHHHHHVDLSKRFGIAGYLSDRSIAAMADFLYTRPKSALVEQEQAEVTHTQQNSSFEQSKEN